MRKLFLTVALVVVSACTSTAPDTIVPDPNVQMNGIADKYVRLVLAMGEHDADYVDAYYGPPAWREEVKAAKPALADIKARAVSLREEITLIDQPAEPMLALRHTYLTKQLDSLLARLSMLEGRKMTFDQESRALYDAEAPRHGEAHFQSLLKELDKQLPGKGPVADRLEAFRSDFVIPKDKLDTVFRAAVEGCRARTMEHLELPAEESFTIEYVTNKSWSGYNWYQGNYKSLIQVNTDLPIYIDRAVDLACHEGYPGHHAYNVLLEKHLVRDRGWTEFTVYPLFSPQSLIAEGSANYGIDVAFPQDERVKFEKENLFPLAGLDAKKADRYYKVFELTSKLAYAGNEAARQYLNGDITADQAAEWLTKYALMAPARAKQRVKFMEQYRSYVINYNLGKDLVKTYIEAKGGTAGNPGQRWKIFGDLISSPRLPSGLR